MPYRVAKKREDYQPFFLPNILEKYIFTVAVTKGVILGGMWVKSPTSDLPVCIFSSHFLLFSISIFTKQHFNNISQYSLRSNSGLGSVLNHLCVSINLSYNRERISDGENCSLERFSHTWGWKFSHTVGSSTESTVCLQIPRSSVVNNNTSSEETALYLTWLVINISCF